MTASSPLPLPPRGVGLGIAAASLAILVLQIALTRLLSVVLWYHFAFVAISLAMLGLALAGIGLYLLPSLLRATPRLLPWYCRGAALSAVAALGYVTLGTHAPSGVDLFQPGVAALYVVLLVPFTLAGLAVSATLTFHAPHIGRLYAKDLAGAALGCLVTVPLLDSGGAPTAVLFAAIVLLLAALAYTGRGPRALDTALLLVTGTALGWQVVTGGFEPTAMHGIADTDAAQGKPIDFAGWNSHSRILVTPTSDWSKLINIDGHATTGIYRFDRQVDRTAVQAQLNWMPIRSGSMPYVLLGADDSGAAGDGAPASPPRVLLIGPGGGLDLLNGIYFGARITGVELNGLIHRLMTTGPIADWAGHVYQAPGVEVVHDEARSFIRRSDERFDLIQASMIDTWAATANGAFALAENALYTVEAFEDYRAHLTERGIVHFMRWNEAPPRQSLRVLALIAEAMHRAGQADVARHVIVLEEPQPFLAGPTMASVLWSREPLPDAALARLRRAVEERQRIGPVKVLCWPGETHDNELSRFVHADDRAAFCAHYAFDVSPTTDDRPFFFHTARLGDTIAAHDAGAENEQAVAVLRTVLATVLLIAVLAFVVPLAWALLRQQLGSFAMVSARLGYFAALGIGFMLVEIPLLQRFGLYMGHPTWSLSVVLGSLLLGAGCGGTIAGSVPFAATGRALGASLATIVAALSAATVLTPTLLAATLRWSFAARALLTTAVLLPVGMALGTALPLGVRRLHASAGQLVPWAWGMNGVTSVLASVLAVAIGMQAGFTAALAGGIGCYVLASVLARQLG